MEKSLAEWKGKNGNLQDYMATHSFVIEGIWAYFNYLKEQGLRWEHTIGV